MHRGIRNAFTLIEVLVVVSIIALLISILLPALRKSREVTRATVCRVNLDTMYKGHLYYGADNKQFFPDPDWWLWDGIGGSMKSWFPHLYKGGSRPVNSSEWVKFGHIFKYVKNPNAYFCPKDTRRRFAGGIGSGQNYGGVFRGSTAIHSYVRIVHPHQFYREHIGAAADDAGNSLRRSDFINPEKLPQSWKYSGKRFDSRPLRLALLYEEFQNFDERPTWAPSPPNTDNMLNDGYSGFVIGALGLTWQDYISIWHMNNSNLLFFDGHTGAVDAVKFNKKANGSAYALWAAMGGPKP